MITNETAKVDGLLAAKLLYGGDGSTTDIYPPSPDFTVPDEIVRRAEDYYAVVELYRRLFPRSALRRAA